tara:strand:+ start:561 stop:1085 length:525 start_codon:yes stop_codon:yes gene_type:complete
MENWKFINEKYEISNTGKLRNGEYILKGKVGANGYVSYSMSMGNYQRKYEMAHRLVAKAFIENPENKAEVNHIDCNRLNNDVTNLEWCTHSENIKHSRALNRYPKQIKKRTIETINKDRKAKEHKMKAVIDELGNIYCTAKSASSAHGLSSHAVRLAIKNNNKSANLKWSYLNN